jgi:hypothetical protein
MNKLFYVLIPTMLLASCGSSEEKKDEGAATDSTATSEYKAGDEITPDGAMNSEEMLEAMKGKDSLEVKLSAKINAVCKVKGCWMTLDLGNDTEMRVSFKDYAFFVPKDANGKTATVQGWAKVDTTSVEELRHFAEDDGQSKEEIEKITEPKAELSFVASGVLIK